MIRKNRHYEPDANQLDLDLEGGEQREAPVSPVPGDDPDDWKRGGNPFKKFRTTFKGKQLRTPEHEAALKKQRREKRAEGIREMTQERIADVIAPEPVAKRAGDLSEKMAALEARVHEGKENLKPLYGEVEAIIGEIRALGALIPQHEKLMDVPMDTPNYLHDENRSTVADELFGAFEVYREILNNLQTGMAKNGREAVDLQAKASHEFLRGLMERMHGKKGGK